MANVPEASQATEGGSPFEVPITPDGEGSSEHVGADVLSTRLADANVANLEQKKIPLVQARKLQNIPPSGPGRETNIRTAKVGPDRFGNITRSQKTTPSAPETTPVWATAEPKKSQQGDTSIWAAAVESNTSGGQKNEAVGQTAHSGSSPVENVQPYEGKKILSSQEGFLPDKKTIEKILQDTDPNLSEKVRVRDNIILFHFSFLERWNKLPKNLTQEQFDQVDERAHSFYVKVGSGYRRDDTNIGEKLITAYGANEENAKDYFETFKMLAEGGIIKLHGKIGVGTDKEVDLGAKTRDYLKLLAVSSDEQGTHLVDKDAIVQVFLTLDTQRKIDFKSPEVRALFREIEEAYGIEKYGLLPFSVEESRHLVSSSADSIEDLNRLLFTYRSKLRNSDSFELTSNLIGGLLQAYEISKDENSEMIDFLMDANDLNLLSLTDEDTVHFLEYFLLETTETGQGKRLEVIDIENIRKLLEKMGKNGKIDLSNQSVRSLIDKVKEQYGFEILQLEPIKMESSLPPVDGVKEEDLDTEIPTVNLNMDIFSKCDITDDVNGSLPEVKYPMDGYTVALKFLNAMKTKSEFFSRLNTGNIPIVEVRSDGDSYRIVLRDTIGGNNIVVSSVVLKEDSGMKDVFREEHNYIEMADYDTDSSHRFVRVELEEFGTKSQVAKINQIMYFAEVSDLEAGRLYLGQKRLAQLGGVLSFTDVSSGIELSINANQRGVVRNVREEIVSTELIVPQDRRFDPSEMTIIKNRLLELFLNMDDYIISQGGYDRIGAYGGNTPVINIGSIPGLVLQNLIGDKTFR